MAKKGVIFNKMTNFNQMQLLLRLLNLELLMGGFYAKKCYCNRMATDLMIYKLQNSTIKASK